MKKITVIITILIFVIVFGKQVVTFALSDFVQIKLREHTFLIPKKNALERESILPDWLLNMDGLDDGSHTTLFGFDDSELKVNVARYKVASDNQFIDDIDVLMIALTPEEVAMYKNPKDYAMLEDLWRATKSYKNRIVEPSEKPGWYRVYRAIEHPNSWVLLNQFPDSKKPVPTQVSGFLVAQCLMLGPIEKRSASCITYEVIDNILLQFSISDYNLPVLNELRAFIRMKVQKWKQKADKT